jgi:membrane-associated protease RseP (regulator of RpoE activity)
MSEPAPPISSTTDFYRPMPVFVVRPPKRRAALYVIFFLLTVLTTLITGSHIEYNFLHSLPTFAAGDDNPHLFPMIWAVGHPSNLLLGVPFAATLMLILFAHEMGHYLYCRYYGVYATLPFFVPFPSLIGTLGAFIRIRSPIRSRSALFDIGVAGPIAGFAFATTALAVGLHLSKPAPAFVVTPDIQLGYPLVIHLMNRLLGRASLMLAGTILHPVAVAAWVGMFATALNLLPGGQLDGGHIIFALSPRWHRLISTLTILVLIPLGVYCWAGWLLWAVLLRITGMRHPMVPEQPSISRGRSRLALFAAIMLLLTFSPTPLKQSSGRDAWREIREGIRQLRSGQ